MISALVTDEELKAIDDWCEELQTSLAQVRIRIHVLRKRIAFEETPRPS
jgi:hypothetical protein